MIFASSTRARAPAPSLKDFDACWNDAKNSARSGDRAAFILKHASVALLAQQIRSDVDRFAIRWNDLATFYAETLEFVSVLSVLEQAARLKLVELSSLDLLIPMANNDFAFQLAVGTGRTAFLDVLEGRQHASSYFLKVICWAKYLNPAEPTRLDARLIWYRIASAAANITFRRLERSIIIPDYLEPLLDLSSHRTLSWHTHGKVPGTVHFKPADIPRFAVIDEGGYSGWSSMASTSLQAAIAGVDGEIASDYLGAHRREILFHNVSKYSQSAFDSAPLDFEYVFVALQTRHDRTQQCAYIPMIDMLEMVTERFSGTSTRVVVKRHPHCGDADIEKKLAGLASEGKIIIRDDSIHALIRGACAVFTVNSGVGSEAMIHSKPIYTFGGCDYAAATHVIRSNADLKRFTNPIRPVIERDNLAKFIWHYRNRYLVNVDDTARLRSAVRNAILG